MATYATLAELKSQTNKNSDDDDLILQALLDSASAAIDAYCNRQPDGFLSASTATARVYAGSGSSYQRIDDCTEITEVAVKTSRSNTTYATWAATDWVPFSGDYKNPDFNRTPYDAIMIAAGGSYYEFLSGSYAGLQGFRPERDSVSVVPTVQVTAKWGYASTVPTQVKQATIIVASRWYKRGQGAWSDVIGTENISSLSFVQSLDPDVKMILSGGRLKKPLFR